MGYWSLGGDDGARTRDLLTASQVLFQLSYAPETPNTTKCADLFGSHDKPDIEREHQPERKLNFSGLCSREPLN